MASSELGHYVRFGESLIGEDDFADAGMCRRALGNLDHLADQFAQVRVASLFPSGDYASPYEASPSTGTFYEVWRSNSFDLHVKADGSSYPCRVRLRVTSNHASYAATFRAVLSWEGANHRAEALRNDDNVESVSTTSATVSWKQPAGLIYLDDDRVERAREDIAAIESVGGEERTGTRLRACLVVFGSIANAAAQARLHGALVHEFFEP